MAADREAATANPGEALGPLGRPRVGGGTATRAATATAGTGAVHRRGRAGIWAVFAALILVVAVAAVGIAGGRFAGTPSNRAGDVAGTTLVRGGASSVLSSGTALAAGDEVTVGAGGHATLDLGASLARLDSGADVRLDGLSASTVQLTLVAGRIYSRVSLPAGGTYAVATGPFSWSATGTAFDLDLTPGPTGAGQVSLLALEHSVTVSGPNTETEVSEGNLATVGFGGSSPSALAVGPIPTSAFTDPWLITNAQADERLGDPIGALAGVALAPNGTPTAGPSQSVAPSAAPVDGASPSPSDQPSPTADAQPESNPDDRSDRPPDANSDGEPEPDADGDTKAELQPDIDVLPRRGRPGLDEIHRLGLREVRHAAQQRTGHRGDVSPGRHDHGHHRFDIQQVDQHWLRSDRKHDRVLPDLRPRLERPCPCCQPTEDVQRPPDGRPRALDVSPNHNLLVWQRGPVCPSAASASTGHLHFSNPIQQTVKVA